MKAQRNDQLFTRRIFLEGGLVAAGGVILSACSSSTSSAPPATGGTTSETPAASAFPVTVEHARGSTVIEAAPERVIALGYSDQDPILALGVVPVGLREWLALYPDEVAPWQEATLGGATPEVLGWPIPFEQIAGLQPDLIIAVYEGLTDEQYARLSRIAPTVAHDPDYTEYGTPWEEMHRTVGQALGQSDQMEALITGIEEQLATLAGEHPEFQGKTGLILAGGFGDEKQFTIYTANDPRPELLAALGLEIPPAVEAEQSDSYYDFFSIERLALLDEADVVVWLPYAEGEVQYVLDDPIYQQLNIVKEGRDIVAPLDVGASLSFASVISIPFALEQLVPALSAAIDGDPAT